MAAVAHSGQCQRHRSRCHRTMCIVRNESCFAVRKSGWTADREAEPTVGTDPQAWFRSLASITSDGPHARNQQLLHLFVCASVTNIKTEATGTFINLVVLDNTKFIKTGLQLLRNYHSRIFLRSGVTWSITWRLSTKR